MVTSLQLEVLLEMNLTVVPLTDFPQAHHYGNHNDAQSHHVETDLFVSKVFDEVCSRF